MKKDMKKNNKSGGGVFAGVGLIAALAGAYFLYGAKNAKKNRANVKGWIIKAKGELVEKLEKTRLATEDQYNTMVDTVMKKYESASSVDKKELEALRRDLKKHWKFLKSEINRVKKA